MVKTKQFKFKDPYLKNEIVFKVVPMENFEVTPHQRKPSQYHIKHLINSIERIGYIVPVVAVERDNKYIIIDGQHRFLAAKEL